MLIKKTTDVAEQEMGQGCKGVRMRWLVGADDGAPHFAMRRFEVDAGGHTPHHDHAWEHECYILSGEGVIVDGQGNENQIKAGDCIYVPCCEKHQFRNTSEQPLQFLCMVPNPDRACDPADDASGQACCDPKTGCC
jgi:quercetin dioxygenase-like cupin family protein